MLVMLKKMLNMVNYLNLSFNFQTKIKKGFPRVLEITKAKKNIATPTMTIYLKEPICNHKNLVEHYAKKMVYIQVKNISSFDIYYEPDMHKTNIEEDKLWLKDFHFQQKFTMFEETAEDNVNCATIMKLHNVISDFPEYITIKGSKGYCKQNGYLMETYDQENFDYYNNQDRLWSTLIIRYIFNLTEMKKYNITLNYIMHAIELKFGKFYHFYIF
jgi:DNA-directed RNA polymerase beta' subunit